MERHAHRMVYRKLRWITANLTDSPTRSPTNLDQLKVIDLDDIESDVIVFYTNILIKYIVGEVPYY